MAWPSDPSASPPSLDVLRGILREVFGHPDFRPGQVEVIARILEGRPTLAVMPTGAGKSLCYQLPALALPGVAVVVSPLIALMRDQVAALHARGVRAASWTSATPPEARRAIMDRLEDGGLDLLYVAPERFRSPQALARIAAARPSLFVVDEVHCVSQWGHDFRPDYARLGEVLARLRAEGPIRFAGLTATATERVRADIIESLGLSAAIETVVTGFDRPNLELSVVEVRGGGKPGMTAKIEAVLEALDAWMGDTGSAIVYVPTRRQAEEVAAALSHSGREAAAYHAGLDPGAREAIQQAFESTPSYVVVATSAFGMGIDKSDVRVVVHLYLPDSPEAYYQEVGRAGRDGRPAGGVLVFDPADLRYAYRRLEAACPSPALVAKIREDLDHNLDAARPIDFEPLSVALEARFGAAARAALVALERAGDLTLGPDGVELSPGPSRIDPALLEDRARHERQRLSTAIGYVTRASCRRRYLVDYFGDARRLDRCGACDRCQAPSAGPLPAEVHTAALMALSCVARMRGRFGKIRVAEVLLGAKTRSVLDAGLDRLSTYGLLSAWAKPEVLALLDSLIRADLARLSLDEFPRLALTEAGANALRERGSLELDFERHPGPARGRGRRPDDPGERLGLSEADRPLFERLRAWRSETARASAVPAYVVAADAVLTRIAERRPRTLEALAAIEGIGPAKLARHGREVLELVRAHAEEPSA